MDKIIKIILENDIIEGFGKKRKKKKKKKAEAAATVTNDDGSVTTTDGSTVSKVDIDYGKIDCKKKCKKIGNYAKCYRKCTRRNRRRKKVALAAEGYSISEVKDANVAFKGAVKDKLKDLKDEAKQSIEEKSLKDIKTKQPVKCQNEICNIVEGSISWTELLIYSFIPYSDIYLRATRFNNTVDHMWTTLPIFQLPGTVFIPLLMMKLEYIKNGDKCGVAYDWYPLIFFVLKYLSYIIIESNPDDFPNNIKTDILPTYIGIVIPLMIRNYGHVNDLCKDYKDSSYAGNVVTKTLAQAAIIQFLITFTILYIPGFTTLDFILTEPFSFTIVFFGLYVAFNIYNINNTKMICNESTYNGAAIVTFFIIIIVLFGMLRNQKYIDILTKPTNMAYNLLGW
jgi:hypothetical protein